MTDEAGDDGIFRQRAAEKFRRRSLERKKSYVITIFSAGGTTSEFSRSENSGVFCPSVPNS